jgi:hypothetical protein
MKKHDQHIIEAVYLLKHEGKGDAEIGDAVGLTEVQVKNLCRKRGHRQPAPGRIDIPVGAELLRELQIEARARGERFDAFMREMLGFIVKDKLYNAIIDKK